MKEEGREYTDTSADANVYLQMLILSLAAKHKSWEHEREYRIICHRDDFPAIPSKIYIGFNCKEEYKKELVKVGKSIDVCKVYQMEFDEDSNVFGFKKQDKEGWGEKVIDRMAKDLKDAFPDMSGFSSRNIKYMRKFAECWPDFEFVQQVVAQIPWRTNIKLLDKLDDKESRIWYACKTIENG